MRIQRHEAEILNKMKIMLEQVNITKDQADLIVTRLKNLDNPQTSKYIPKFVAARKEKDLIKVKEEIDEELDAIKNLLQDNHDKFMKFGINSSCLKIKQLFTSSFWTVVFELQAVFEL